MGLDMWMYGIKDISNDEILDYEPESYYDEKGYDVIEIEENNEFEELVNDLYEYCVIRNVEFCDTDFDKMKKDYGINPEAYLSRWGGSGILGFSQGEYYKEITLTQEEVDKYDVKVTKRALIYKAEQLAYWRKEYDLQTLIYNNYNGQVQNCGFHELDDDLMKKINRYLKSRNMDKQSINNDGYVAKMYHEWY